jgi:hypothetical protein
MREAHGPGAVTALFFATIALALVFVGSSVIIW